MNDNSKKEKKSSTTEKEDSYDKDYNVISKQDSKQYKSDNLSLEVIDYKL